MRDTRVEEVEQISSDSDSDETEVAASLAGGGGGQQPDSLSSLPDGGGGGLSKRPTVGIFPNHVQQGPTYLIFGGQVKTEMLSTVFKVTDERFVCRRRRKSGCTT